MKKFLPWFKDHFAISFCHPNRHFLLVVFGRLAVAVGFTILKQHAPAASIFAILDQEDF